MGGGGGGRDGDREETDKAGKGLSHGNHRRGVAGSVMQRFTCQAAPADLCSVNEEFHSGCCERTLLLRFQRRAGEVAEAKEEDKQHMARLMRQEEALTEQEIELTEQEIELEKQAR